MREKLINLICKLIPILIIAVTIIGFFFALGIGKINWALQGLYLAIPAVIACLIIYDLKATILILNLPKTWFYLIEESFFFCFLSSSLYVSLG